MSDPKIGVVGAGIVGLAVAREITARYPGARVVVFEKEDRVAAHQTQRNSGVVHAGIYYKPGSLKAELCTRGRARIKEYCQEHGLPYDERGKLVVALDQDELERLDRLQQTASANAVPGLTRLTHDELVAVEPRVTGLAALHSPATAITDFVAVAEQYARDVAAAGGEVRTASPVLGIDNRPGHVEVHTPQGAERVDYLITCAGLHGDRLTRGRRAETAIVPFRGEYLHVVNPAKAQIVTKLVYPVPDPRYPFLGVHFTPRVDGGLEIGPNAVVGLMRESYAERRRFDRADLGAMARWPGTWRLARRHWRTGVKELWESRSVAAYVKVAQRYLPSLEAADVARARVGVRAQAVGRDGSMVDDFVINQEDRVVEVRNAPSPAATSSLAIAELIVDRIRLAG